MVGPLYRDPRPAAQLLISSAAHQSLVHDHRLVKSRPPYRRNLASRAISRHERERERGGCSFRSYLRSYVLYVGLTNRSVSRNVSFRVSTYLLNPPPPSPLPSMFTILLSSSRFFDSSPFFFFVLHTSSYIYIYVSRR